LIVSFMVIATLLALPTLVASTWSRSSFSSTSSGETTPREDPEESSETSRSKLTILLNDEEGREAFLKFLEQELSFENLLFWEAVQEWNRRIEKLDEIDEKAQVEAKRIFDLFICCKGPHQVNLKHETRSELIKACKGTGTLCRGVFNRAGEEVFHLMYRDSFLRFQACQSYISLRQRLFSICK